MKKTVIVEVYGGVASVVRTFKGVTVIIKDYDNKVSYKNIDGQNYESKELK